MPTVDELLAVVDAAVESNDLASDMEAQQPLPFHVVQAGLLGEAVVCDSNKIAAVSTMPYGAASLPSFSELDREWLERSHLRYACLLHLRNQIKQFYYAQ
jgi:hypothetical protein